MSEWEAVAEKWNQAADDVVTATNPQRACLLACLADYIATLSACQTSACVDQATADYAMCRSNCYSPGS